MMNNLTQSFLCLLAAAALGLLFGWWLRRHLARNQLNEVKLSSQRVIADERARYAQLDEQLARAASEADGLRQQLNAATNASLDSRRKHELELAQLRTQESTSANTAVPTSDVLQELDKLRAANAEKTKELEAAR
jgi:hypothetical protein